MKFFLLISTVILCVQTAYTQTTFQKTYGGNKDYASSVQQTNDGGFIVAGSTYNFGVGNSDIYLIKMASDGTTQWAKAYGEAADEVGYSVQQTVDGGFAVAGQTSSFGAGNTDVYLVKTNSGGILQWSRTYGGTGEERGTFLRQISNGGFIIGGTTASYAGDADGDDYALYLIRTTSSGFIQTTSSIGNQNFSLSGYDFGYAGQETNDSGFVICGLADLFSPSGNSVYLAKTDFYGSLLWTRTYGGTNDNNAYAMQKTTDGGFAIAGETNSFGTGLYSVYLVKTDSDGNMQWTKTYGTSAYNTSGRALQQTNDGGFIIAGSIYNSTGTYADAYLVKIDSDGTLKWSKAYGSSGAEQAFAVSQTNDNGFIIVGQTTSFGSPNGNIYVVKTDSSGNSGCNQTTVNTIVGSGGTQGSGGSQTIGGQSSSHVSYETSGVLETTLCTTVGINENNYQQTFSIFPNPFSSSTTLQAENILHNATLTAYNSFGQKVKEEQNISGQEIIFHRENLPSGLYFIRLTEGNKIIATDKLVITDN